MNLRTLLGLDGKTIKLHTGERLKLKPLTLRQSLIVERAFTPVAEAMAEYGVGALEVYAQHADDLIQVVATACDKTPDQVGEWAYDDFTRVLSALLELNRDFFSGLVLRAAAQAEQNNKPESKSPTGAPSRSA